MCCRSTGLVLCPSLWTGVSLLGLLELGRCLMTNAAYRKASPHSHAGACAWLSITLAIVVRVRMALSARPFCHDADGAVVSLMGIFSSWKISAISP